MTNKWLARLIVFTILIFHLNGCDKVANKKVTQIESLDCSLFETSVNAIFDAPINTPYGVATCSASGCHRLNDGAGGNFRITPNAAPGSIAMQRNFISATSFANLSDPASSLLIQKPLTGRIPTVGGHGGGNIIQVDDSYYATLFQWISDPTGKGDCQATPSGSVKLALDKRFDETFYAQKVNPLFDQPYASGKEVQTCASAGCHFQSETNSLHFKLFAHAKTGSVEMHINFLNAVAMVNLFMPPSSPLLIKITADSGFSHAGGSLVTQGDPNYLTLYQWVMGP